jgi:Zn-finger nucleic acid-binding protein
LWLGNLNKIISQSSQEPADYFVKKNGTIRRAIARERERERGEIRRTKKKKVRWKPMSDNDQQTTTQP